MLNAALESLMARLLVSLLLLVLGCNGSDTPGSNDDPTGPSFATLAVTTTVLPDAELTVAYDETLVATGGNSSYTWSVTAGSLPTGLSLATTGAISGTPSVVGTSDFTVGVTSGDGQTVPQVLSIATSPPPGFTLIESGGVTTVSEDNAVDDFTVVLDATPVSDVVFNVVPEQGEGHATVNSTVLTFTTTDWNVPQTVVVNGVDDPDLDGDQLTTITILVLDNLSDDAFDPLLDQTVIVTTTDNDVASFTITESGGDTRVTETGGTDSFTVVLDARPTSDVVLTVLSGDPSEATVNPTTLTFTALTYGIPQPVTVAGVDDFLVDGDQLTTITVAVDQGLSDDEFDLALDRVVSVTTTDDDVAPLVWTLESIDGTSNVLSVWASSPSDVWVGGGYRTLQHFDGSTWSQPPLPAATQNTNSVFGFTSNSVFAAGQRGVLHWNGTNWSFVLSGVGELFGIWGTSPSDLFVSGDGRFLHFNGVSWTDIPTGFSTAFNTDRFPAMWGTSPTNVFLGGRGVGFGRIAHYDGSNVTEVLTIPGVNVHSIHGTGENDVFAVGAGGHIWHFDGTSWSEMVSPTTNSLGGIYAVSPSDVYAAGTNGTLLHYDGVDWSSVPSGNTLFLGGIAYGVFALSPDLVYVTATLGSLLVGRR